MKMYSENKKKFLIFFFKPFSLLAQESFQPKAEVRTTPSFPPFGSRNRACDPTQFSAQLQPGPPAPTRP
jgi:hypothetical protein